MKTSEDGAKGLSCDTSKKTADHGEIPDENFKRLLKAVKECPATAEELWIKSEQEERERRRKEAHSN